MTILFALLLLLCAPAVAFAQTTPPHEARAVLRAMEDAFTAVADRVMPAVVNVTTAPKKTSFGGGEDRPHPFGEFFEDFRRRPHPPTPRATGSGVIVDPNGYVLTNNHVIENASEITVRLSDARKLKATLVGRDPKTDLAVLKVETSSPLPAAELGDSDALRIGQWAIAIGSPFGLDRTVTVGIISATARTRVGLATYENFIQTDASINPGNSGGPLINIDGRVVGINTAIVAAGQGIGFAIPINMAKDVMRQLISGGRVVRGWLGIAIQDVTDELGKSFGVAERDGVLIAQVMDGSPAEAAGLKAGDVVVEFGGSVIHETPELQRRVAAVLPGQQVPVKVNREGKTLTLTVTVGEMPSDEPVAAADVPAETWGVRVEALSPEMAQRFGIGGPGVVVSEVAPGSAAGRSGLQRGDVVLDVAGQPVTDAASFYRALDQSAGSTRLYVFRHGAQASRQFLVVERPPRQ